MSCKTYEIPKRIIDQNELESMLPFAGDIFPARSEGIHLQHKDAATPTNSVLSGYRMFYPGRMTEKSPYIISYPNCVLVPAPGCTEPPPLFTQMPNRWLNRYFGEMFANAELSLAWVAYVDRREEGFHELVITEVKGATHAILLANWTGGYDSSTVAHIRRRQFSQEYQATHLAHIHAEKTKYGYEQDHWLLPITDIGQECVDYFRDEHDSLLNRYEQNWRNYDVHRRNFRESMLELVDDLARKGYTLDCGDTRCATITRNDGSDSGCVWYNDSWYQAMYRIAKSSNNAEICRIEFGKFPVIVEYATKAS